MPVFLHGPINDAPATPIGPNDSTVWRALLPDADDWDMEVFVLDVRPGFPAPEAVRQAGSRACAMRRRACAASPPCATASAGVVCVAASKRPLEMEPHFKPRLHWARSPHPRLQVGRYNNYGMLLLAGEGLLRLGDSW